MLPAEVGGASCVSAILLALCLPCFVSRVVRTMPESPNSTWVLPTHIPFSSLTKRELEECVYWLLDAMGAKDLEWREGGSGNGAADGGRDLEATFHMPTPDGQMEPQR